MARSKKTKKSKSPSLNCLNGGAIILSLTTLGIFAYGCLIYWPGMTYVKQLPQYFGLKNIHNPLLSAAPLNKPTINRRKIVTQPLKNESSDRVEFEFYNTLSRNQVIVSKQPLQSNNRSNSPNAIPRNSQSFMTVEELERDVRKHIK